jgi:hypothetical protein
MSGVEPAHVEVDYLFWPIGWRPAEHFIDLIPVVFFFAGRFGTLVLMHQGKRVAELVPHDQ